jgi:malonyl CoA-acyl carrier protein transacylase
VEAPADIEEIEPVEVPAVLVVAIVAMEALAEAETEEALAEAVVIDHSQLEAERAWVNTLIRPNL